MCEPGAGAAPGGVSGGGFAFLDHVEGDVDDHVFLPADHLATAQFHEDGAGVEAVGFGGLFRMTQEGGINPGIAQREGLAVDPNRAGPARGEPDPRPRPSAP